MAETSSEQLPNLTAGFAEGETKTYVESGKYLRWHEDDRLTAFLGNTLNRQYKFDGATGDNSGSFSHVPSGNLETGNTLDRIYAIYPYDETATITDDGQISLTLPAVQTYAENSFGRGANTMLAATENLEDTFLPFKNVCGYLKLKLYNADGATIKSIDVKGNGEEKISGAATATIAFGEVPQLTMADDATTTITLDCGDGVALGTTAETATEFWVVIPETTFESGITITVSDTEGGIFDKSTTKEVVVERNAVQPMAALEVVCIKRLPKNNEIWYTATEKVEPYDKTVFGATYQSNEWNSATGEGVITFDNQITKIGDSAFAHCLSLASVTIPDSVTEIGDDAFSSCFSLTSVTLGNGVTAIGDGAFKFCFSLTSVTIPDSITTIGDSAFSCCDSLQEFSGKFASEDGRCLVIEGVLKCFAPAGITGYTIPDSVTAIGEYAFSYCSTLTSVTIPDSVTTIGHNAFKYCNSLQEFSGKFASEDGRCLVIEGVLKCFAPAGITGYTIPDSVTAIGDYAFSGCSSLTSVTIPDSVTAIGDYAFSEFQSLTNVTIPNSVTAIGDYAFSCCDSLTSVTFGNGVTTIGEYAFFSCVNLTSVTFGNGVTTIGEYAFSYCSTLTSVTIPDSVTAIGDGAFKYCSSLANVTFGNGVTTIGEYAFHYCSRLTSVTFGNGVTTIGDSAFFGCSSLTNVTIPDSVTSIGDDAFSDCSSLTSITIPDSVTTIGDAAFTYCSRLKSIYCKPITPPAGGNVMFDTYSSIKIYVPTESVEAYKNASYWNDYASKIVGYDF